MAIRPVRCGPWPSPVQRAAARGRWARAPPRATALGAVCLLPRVARVKPLGHLCPFFFQGQVEPESKKKFPSGMISYVNDCQPNTMSCKDL